MSYGHISILTTQHQKNINTTVDLRHNGREAWLLLETQQDGYSDKFLAHVDTAIEIFEEKFPHAQALFLFDNAPIHCMLQYYQADKLWIAEKKFNMKKQR